MKTFYSLNKKSARQEMNDELIIMLAQNSQIFTLNDIAKDICELLNEKKTFDEILDFSTSGYEGDTDRIKKELMEFLDHSEAEGIIIKETT